MLIDMDTGKVYEDSNKKCCAGCTCLFCNDDWHMKCGNCKTCSNQKHWTNKCRNVDSSPSFCSVFGH
ncbi:MAG: hypothetical protein NC548_43270 [Lachnospiraceae bacterium]|nr:hypothetical protein [Lachnospiraceae bacterium]MCM1237718.1 hypothetical protein [Ruminococcus flavefaciens]